MRRHRQAPSTTLHVRDIVKQIYGFTILHGEKVANSAVADSADEVGPSAIAHFVPRDRSLSPTETRVMPKQLERVATLPIIRLGLRLIRIRPTGTTVGGLVNFGEQVRNRLYGRLYGHIGQPA